ncbi:hypothetical protein [Achromobacter anxifer]|uniref:hypothetical protein n=1 Tax=Achromobacter anxifer TaxID=1287737 RepID=UPI002157D7CC|nr:hypothetical protein [Achromobacter anxifer]
MTAYPLIELETELPTFKQACARVSRHRKAALVAAALTLGSSAALAQQAAPGQMPNLAALSGQMHAAAEYCNAYTATQLDQMKQQQKTAAGAQGLSAADFDSAFTQSYTATKGQLGSLSAADKEKTCAQLKAVSQMRTQ